MANNAADRGGVRVADSFAGSGGGRPAGPRADLGMNVVVGTLAGGVYVG